MAKTRSNSSKKRTSSRIKVKDKTIEELLENEKSSRKIHEKKWVKEKVAKTRGDIKEKRSHYFLPHRSFRRSYREDYKRDLNVPGIMYHVMATFRIIFRNWRLFLPLLIIAVILNAVFVGIMSESNYVQFQDIMDQTSKEVTGDVIGGIGKAGMLLISTISTGGLSGESSEAAIVFGVLIFLIIWLTTIFIIRHLLAGHSIKLRDALYNSTTPLVSSFLIFVVAVIQCIPIFFLVIVYSAAVQTDFLATPFYALVFFVFALAMITLSGYLLSSSLIAFVAVSAPGMYPLQALRASSDLMMGRRMKFIIRLIALVITLVLFWVLIMLPVIAFDLWMKQFEWTAGFPFVPICLTIMTCFTAIYVTAYLYMYYRWMLKN